MNEKKVVALKLAWSKAVSLGGVDLEWAKKSLALGLEMTTEELGSCRLCETFSEEWKKRVVSKRTLGYLSGHEIGSLLARAALKGAVKAGSYRSSGSPLAAPLTLCAELGEALLSGPKMWDELFCADLGLFGDGNKELRADAVGSFLAKVPTRSAAGPGSEWGQENAREISSQGWIVQWPRMSEQVKERYPEMLDKAVKAGLLDHLKKSARGGVWALHCALEGNMERLREAVGAGVRLDKMSHEMALGYLNAFMIASYQGVRGCDKKYGRAGKAEVARAKEKDAASKKEAWELLAKAGLPVANPPEPYDWGRCVAGRGLWVNAEMMKIEAQRGGFVTGAGLFHWGKLALEAGPEQKGLFSGATPLAWAFGASMKASDWTHGALDALSFQAGEGCRIDALLGDLAAAGVRLGPREDALTGGGIGWERESLVARLVHIGASASGLMSAAKIGVDMRERGTEGTPPLAALFKLNRTGRYAERAKGLLEAAEASKKGGAAKLLSMRGTDGSGPMHWAARALCAQSVEILAKLGESATEKDEKGRSPGHWAAKKYGEKGLSKVGPTLKALTLAGADWSALDAKGVSAMAALAARGPLEAVADLLEAAPEALWAKSGEAKSAMEVMGAREPRALALAERVALGSGIEKERQGAPKPRKQRL